MTDRAWVYSAAGLVLIGVNLWLGLEARHWIPWAVALGLLILAAKNVLQSLIDREAKGRRPRAQTERPPARDPAPEPDQNRIRERLERYADAAPRSERPPPGQHTFTKEELERYFGEDAAIRVGKHELKVRDLEK